MFSNNLVNSAEVILVRRGWWPRAHYWLLTVGLIIFMAGFMWTRSSGHFKLVPPGLGYLSVALSVLLIACTCLGACRAGRSHKCCQSKIGG